MFLNAKFWGGHHFCIKKREKIALVYISKCPKFGWSSFCLSKIDTLAFELLTFNQVLSRTTILVLVVVLVAYLILVVHLLVEVVVLLV